MAEPIKKSNKFRLVVFEGDFTDGSISEISQALTSALRPTVAPTMRQLANGKPAAQILPPEAEEDRLEEEEDAGIETEAGDEGEEEAPVQKASKSSRPKKTKAPIYMHDLISDGNAAKAFASEKAPASKNRQYLSAIYWLKEVNSTPTANRDKVYTFYKTVGWNVGFNDWNQPFHNLLSEDLIRKGESAGEYVINPTGEAVVKSLPE
ncbi:MAG TPA: hypothetical protein VFW25_02050 [Silvibacterium sp.]|nr:hypothetical protein [Silvibacterium sp.]